jgi:hypothetical protein
MRHTEREHPLEQLRCLDPSIAGGTGLVGQWLASVRVVGIRAGPQSMLRIHRRFHRYGRRKRCSMTAAALTA